MLLFISPEDRLLEHCPLEGCLLERNLQLQAVPWLLVTCDIMKNNEQIVLINNCLRLPFSVCSSCCRQRIISIIYLHS
jgi:hypothetical protein